MLRLSLFLFNLKINLPGCEVVADSGTTAAEESAGLISILGGLAELISSFGRSAWLIFCPGKSVEVISSFGRLEWLISGILKSAELMISSLEVSANWLCIGSGIRVPERYGWWKTYSENQMAYKNKNDIRWNISHILLCGVRNSSNNSTFGHFHLFFKKKKLRKNKKKYNLIALILNDSFYFFHRKSSQFVMLFMSLNNTNYHQL